MATAPTYRLQDANRHEEDRMLWRMLVLPVLALALAGVAACGDDDDGGGPSETTAPADIATDAPSDGATTVQAIDFAFDKASIGGEAGSTVEIDFSNEGLATHTFTVDEIDVDLQLSPGESGTVQFTFPDESFEFYCRFHPTQMRGTLEPGG
ncbi:MAG: cupredoxin domain-containing protein [Chloroflexi bacterium]|nr:cupredoxin domain-containing protein [Chloroflexota bacterium]MCI0816853.1 cupredoxin domain-containing protein [Chloroflexota bacterium]MCI0819848.1 cupredoxin domain-containing protein [Chloroflexota bacterium]MCI0832599.1 cupredoxin domain-containing protein [Chloroflexota bacterium]MCI0843502.1 cupredoxin domain-containing protein [Chloroflexota bacterium]